MLYILNGAILEVEGGADEEEAHAGEGVGEAEEEEEDLFAV